MKLLGLIPESPYDPLSWSGSSANFFRTLKGLGVLSDACEISLGAVREAVEKGRRLSLPMSRWKERYHASVPRFNALTKAAGRVIAKHGDATGVLQIGAWFSAGAVTGLPHFSYHDGNAALRYRYYGRGLLSDRVRRAHLRWEGATYAAMTGVFVMSEWLANSFCEDFNVPRRKVHVVGAGINLEKLPDVPKRSWSTPKFLLVGRDFERKGGRYLLEAFRIARKALPDAELIIVGPTLPIDEPGVKCMGYLSKSKPADVAVLDKIFCSATTMVLPSIYEPFGISLLEGMAYGLPCIAVDRCAMPEIVKHGNTGLIARAEDSQSLADALVELGRDPLGAAKMGVAGRSRIEAHFTWNAVVLKIMGILSSTYNLR